MKSLRPRLAWLLSRAADAVHSLPPSDEFAELRTRALLAWNNWPDTAESRKVIAANHARDQFSVRSWDRVIRAIRA